MAITMDHAVRMLLISGYTRDEARVALQELTFPARLEDVVAVFGRLGITRDDLINRMGGSP